MYFEVNMERLIWPPFWKPNTLGINAQMKCEVVHGRILFRWIETEINHPTAITPLDLRVPQETPTLLSSTLLHPISPSPTAGSLKSTILMLSFVFLCRCSLIRYEWTRRYFETHKQWWGSFSPGFMGLRRAWNSLYVLTGKYMGVPSLKMHDRFWREQLILPSCKSRAWFKQFH